MLFSDATKFCLKEVPGAEFSIQRDVSGEVVALLLKQGGAEMRFPKKE